MAKRKNITQRYIEYVVELVCQCRVSKGKEKKEFFKGLEDEIYMLLTSTSGYNFKEEIRREIIGNLHTEFSFLPGYAPWREDEPKRYAKWLVESNLKSVEFTIPSGFLDSVLPHFDDFIYESLNANILILLCYSKDYAPVFYHFTEKEIEINRKLEQEKQKKQQLELKNAEKIAAEKQSQKKLQLEKQQQQQKQHQHQAELKKQKLEAQKKKDQNSFFIKNDINGAVDGPFREIDVKNLLNENKINLKTEIKKGKDSTTFKQVIDFKEFIDDFEDFI